MKLLNYINSIYTNILNLKTSFKELAERKGINIKPSIPFNEYPQYFEGIDVVLPEDELKKDLHLTRILNNCPNIVDFNLDEAKFCEKAGEHGDYKFTYNKEEDSWKFYGVDNVNLKDWGINGEILETVSTETVMYTLTGNPTIEDKVASNFDSSNYINLPYFTSRYNTWKLHIKFETNDDITTKQNIWYIQNGDTMGFIYEGYLNLVISGATSWNTTEHRLPLEPNTIYTGEWEYNGETYTLTLTKEDGTSLSTSAQGSNYFENNAMYLGSKASGGEYFLGKIYLSDCWYDINNEREWEAISAKRPLFTKISEVQANLNTASRFDSYSYITFKIPQYTSVESAEVILKAKVDYYVDNYPQLLSFAGNNGHSHVFGVLGSGYPAIYNGSGDITTDIYVKDKLVWFKNTFKDGMNVLSVIEDNNYTLDTLPEEGWISSTSCRMTGVDYSFISPNGTYVLGNNAVILEGTSNNQYWTGEVYLPTIKFIVNGEEVKDIIYTEEPRYLTDGDNFTISIHDNSDGFKPYWDLDLNAILDEHPSIEANGKVYTTDFRWITLFNDNDDVWTFKVRDNTNDEPIGVLTSDGSVYRGISGTYIYYDHTWDKSKDIICEDGRRIRWAIQYYHRPWSLDSLQLNGSSVYAYGKVPLGSISKSGMVSSPNFEGINKVTYSDVYDFQQVEAGSCYSFRHLQSKNPLDYETPISQYNYNPSFTVYGSKVFIPFSLLDAVNISELFKYAASKIARVSLLDKLDKSQTSIIASDTNIEKIEGILDFSEFTATSRFYLFSQSRCLKSFKVILPKYAERILFGNGYLGYGVPDVDDESLVFLAKYAPKVNGTYLETPYAFRGKLFHCKELIPYEGQQLTPLELLRAKGWNVDM